MSEKIEPVGEHSFVAETKNLLMVRGPVELREIYIDHDQDDDDYYTLTIKDAESGVPRLRVSYSTKYSDPEQPSRFGLFPVMWPLVFNKDEVLKLELDKDPRGPVTVTLKYGEKEQLNLEE